MWHEDKQPIGRPAEIPTQRTTRQPRPLTHAASALDSVECGETGSLPRPADAHTRGEERTQPNRVHAQTLYPSPHFVARHTLFCIAPIRSHPVLYISFTITRLIVPACFLHFISHRQSWHVRRPSIPFPALTVPASANGHQAPRVLCMCGCVQMLQGLSDGHDSVLGPRGSARVHAATTHARTRGMPFGGGLAKGDDAP